MLLLWSFGVGGLVHGMVLDSRVCFGTGVGGDGVGRWMRGEGLLRGLCCERGGGWVTFLILAAVLDWGC